MEYFPTDIMLFLTFSLAFLLEIVRYRLLGILNLKLTWSGGWRYAYYLPYLALCAGLGSGITIIVTALLNRGWIWAKNLPAPMSVYAGGFFLVVITGGIVTLLYITLRRINSPKPKGMVRPLMILTLLDLACFLWKPSRFIFGGTLLLLVTSAVGRIMPFTTWDGLKRWVSQREGRDNVRLSFIVQAEAALQREKGERVWIYRDEIEKQPVTIPRREQRGRLTTYLTQRIASFAMRYWGEWSRLQKPETRHRYLSAWLAQEFLPGWTEFLQELSQVIQEIIFEARRPPPESPESAKPEHEQGPQDEGENGIDLEEVKLRVQGLLDQRLRISLLSILELDIPQAYGNFIIKLAREQKNKLIDLMLDDWEKLRSWVPTGEKAASESEESLTWESLPAEAKAPGQRNIRNWLLRELLPDWPAELKEGREELYKVVRRVLKCLEEKTEGKVPDREEAEACAETMINQRFPGKWLDALENISIMVEEWHKVDFLARRDRQLERRLLERTQLDMIAQALGQMTSRRDLLKRLVDILVDYLERFSTLYQEIQKEKTKLKEQLEHSREGDGEAPGPMSREERAEWLERKARDRVQAQEQVHKLLSHHLHPIWMEELEGLTQAVLRVLEPLAALYAVEMSEAERRKEVHGLLEKELIVDWQDLLGKLTTLVDQNLLRLVELRDTKMEKEERVNRQITELISPALADWRLQHLFYWDYGMPADGLRLYVTRVPPFQIKPILEWQDYLGLFLTYLTSEQEPPGR